MERNQPCASRHCYRSPATPLAAARAPRHQKDQSFSREDSQKFEKVAPLSSRSEKRANSGHGVRCNCRFDLLVGQLSARSESGSTHCSYRFRQAAEAGLAPRLDWQRSQLIDHQLQAGLPLRQPCASNQNYVWSIQREAKARADTYVAARCSTAR